MMALLQSGDQAPTFSLPNQDGATVESSSYAGKYVLMWWYPKADTPGWTIEGNGFRDRIQEFEDSNAVIIGLSFDSTSDNQAFKNKFEFPFDLLSDTEKTVSVSFGAAKSDQEKASRVSVLIGPDGKVAKSYATVNPAEHPGQVLNDIAKLS
jgi:peroxiredoxin Q/BCP